MYEACQFHTQKTLGHLFIPSLLAHDSVAILPEFFGDYVGSVFLGSIALPPPIFHCGRHLFKASDNS